MNDGTQQSERKPAALAGAQFRVDEQDFESLLSSTIEFAECLRFIDIDGRDSGHWGELLAGNDIAAMARVANLELVRLQARFAEAFETSSAAVLARLVDDLDGKLERYLSGLPATALARLGQGVDALLAPAALPVLARLRQLTGRRPRAPDAPAPTMPDRSALRSAFFALLGATRRLQDLARTGLPAAETSGSQPPAIGLLVAFVRVFARVQERLNRFAARHCDFYYDECLRMPRRAAEPDHLHLVFTRAARVSADVEVPAGVRVSAGQDAAGRPIEFQTERPVLVSDVRVTALKTLRVERDALISPECSFRYATRVVAGSFDAAGDGAAHALFGGAAVGVTDAGRDARLGLAWSTPTLWLKEGERHLSLTLRLALARPRSAEELIDDIDRAASYDGFRAGAGILFAHWLLDPRADVAGAEYSGPFDAAQLARLRDVVRRAADRIAQVRSDWWPSDDVTGVDHGLRLFTDTLPPQRDGVIEALFNGLFILGLSTATGWQEVVSTVVRRGDVNPDGEQGLVLEWRLRPEDPAIVACSPAVHGAEWPTEAPVLRLLVNPHSRVHPLSLLEAVRLTGLDLAVQVEGLRELQLFNQLGHLDAAKPFAAFGPLPETTSSYLVVGGPEIARKPIDRLTLHVDWSGLPDGPGGFAEHYQAYGTQWGNDSFTASAALLRNGEWQQASPDGQPIALFSDETPGGRLLASRAIELDAAALRTQWQPSTQPLAFDHGARGGFVRLQLSGPSGAFGHAAYPGLLTQTLTARTRRRRPLVLPPAPYTPVIARVSVDYGSTSRVRFQRGTAGDSQHVMKVLHLHAFGTELLYPTAAAEPRSVLPTPERDGNLYIALGCARLGGPLSLLFDLREDTAREPALASPPPQLQWAVLVDNRWQSLRPEQVLEDGTQGFRSSGVVVLDLPELSSRANNGVLPGNTFWLRLCTDADPVQFAALRSVRAHGVRATRVREPANSPEPPSGAARWQLTRAVASITAVEVSGTPFGQRPEESIDQRRTRIGERLRHKGRASTLWDYERLVLEACPAVYKVRCFPNLHSPSGATVPGHVLVVVLPQLPADDAELRSRPQRLNAVELQRIKDFLVPLASDCVQLQVRNAAFELVQVRATLRLKHLAVLEGAAASHGRVIQRVNEAIVEYLSPWNEGGHGATFEWSVRGEDIESWIRASVPEVESVSGLSLLQISESDEGSFHLGDSALHALGPGEAAARHRWRWSLALPTETHLIDIAPVDSADASAEVCGIARLRIGESFIVGEPIGGSALP